MKTLKMENNDDFSRKLFLMCLLLLSNQVNSCPDNCDCHDNVLHCYESYFPSDISNNATSVYLEFRHIDNLTVHSFDNSWKHVKKLDIVATEGEWLLGKIFVKLENLEELGLHFEQLQTFDLHLFDGLDNLHTLDLSENLQFELKYLGPCLYNTLPLLTHLILRKIQSFFPNPVNLDESFMAAIASGRQLKYLDISDLNINLIRFDKFQSYLCDSVDTLIARRISVVNPLNYLTKTCDSLTTLDLIDVFLPKITHLLTFQSTAFMWYGLRFYFKVRNLYLNNILKENISPEVVLDNYNLDLSLAGLHVTKVGLALNNIKVLNLTVKLNNITQDHMKEIDFSDNILEYISPLTLGPSINLEFLNLSHNRLYKMQVNHSADFGILFSPLTQLKFLYLGYNGLTDIPKATFVNNLMLTYLDLSHNKLTSVNFMIQHLRNLKILLLNNNQIKILDGVTMSQLDNLAILALTTQNSSRNKVATLTEMFAFFKSVDFFNYESKINMTGFSNYKLGVDLSNNPYDCSCGSEIFASLKWLHSSTVVYSFNQTYTCNLDGSSLDVMKSALTETKDYCEQKIIKHIVQIAAPVCACVVIIAITTAVMLYKSYIKKKNVRNVFEQIENGQFPYKHLVFLSYCNEDGDFVLENFYPKLKEEILKKTKVDSDLVCVGDLHFRPGFSIPNEAMRCIEQSAVVILIVSNIFCQKSWCKMEVREAYAQKKPIIMLMTEKVDLKMMTTFLRRLFHRFTHASWVSDDNGGHIEPDWPIFCDSIILLASSDRSDKKQKSSISNQFSMTRLVKENGAYTEE